MQHHQTVMSPTIGNFHFLSYTITGAAFKNPLLPNTSSSLTGKVKKKNLPSLEEQIALFNIATEESFLFFLLV